MLDLKSLLKSALTDVKSRKHNAFFDYYIVKDFIVPLMDKRPTIFENDDTNYLSFENTEIVEIKLTEQMVTILAGGSGQDNYILTVHWDGEYFICPDYFDSVDEYEEKNGKIPLGLSDVDIELILR